MKDKAVIDFIEALNERLTKDILKRIIFEFPNVRANIESAIKQVNKELKEKK